MTEEHHHFMREALRVAEISGDDVPVGAVIVQNGEIIAIAHNQVEKFKDPTAHAEVLAIREAARKLGTWRLSDASLYVTLEPCIMCIGAILHARILKLLFGAFDPVQGAVGSLFNLSNIPKHPRQVEVFPEILAADSSKLLQGFFESKRP